MSIRNTLKQARETLTLNRIEDANLEAEVLLRHALSLNRVQLYLQPSRELSSEENENFWRLIRRRLDREPTAYITGHREFYGLDFHVDNSVLIPRPESELLVETALALAAKQPLGIIADIGTGSGAIAISLALNFPQARVYATDISSPALRIAGMNCEKHNVANRVCLLQGDLLEPLPEPADLIVANLPYVKAADLPEVNTWGHEPALTLDGGRDGLDVIRRLIGQVKGRLKPGGALLMEIGPGQDEAVTALLHRLFPSSEIGLMPDGNNIKRVVSLLLPPFA